MSMYNGLFGFDPLAPAIMGLLEADPQRVPRFRDAFLDADRFELVIYTRTGGVNRATFAEQNTYLRTLRGFLRTEDDGLDSTYALWRYAPPTDDPEVTALLQAAVAEGMGWRRTPADRWRQLFDDMDHGRETEDTKRALAYGEKVIAPQIAAALKANEDDEDGVAVRIIET